MFVSLTYELGANGHQQAVGKAEKSQER